MKLSLARPPESRIIIFHESGSEIIRNLILKDLPAHTYKISNMTIHLHFSVIFVFINYLRFFSFRKVFKAKNPAKGFLGQFWRIYVAADLNVRNPKVILTLIDNYPIFHWLSKFCRFAKFIAIQNGTRTKLELDTMPDFFLQKYYCFGLYEQDLFTNAGVKVESYSPTGSLLAGFYFRKSVIDATYRIGIISSWRGNIPNTPDVQDSMAGMRKMDDFLSRYIKLHKINVSILLRSSKGTKDRNTPIYGDEVQYFHDIYGSDATLVEPNFETRNIYLWFDDCELIVSQASTGLREAYGLGKKALYCDFSKTQNYTNFQPELVFREFDYQAFAVRMNSLLNISDQEYQQKNIHYMRYLMNFQKNRPAHVIIREEITEALN